MALPKTQEEISHATEALSIDVDLFGTSVQKPLTFQETTGLSTAANNGETVWMNIPFNTVAENEKELHDMLKHEYAHILFQSNRETIKLVHDQFPEIPVDILGDAYNIIEDYRIENNWVRVFPADTPDFAKLKKNTLKYGLKKIQSEKKAPDNPLAALFAARLGDDSQLKDSPKEIKDLYPEFVKALATTDGKNFLASYPVLKQVAEVMDKWLKGAGKSYYERLQQAQQQGQNPNSVKIIIAMPTGAAGAGSGAQQQGSQQGGQGESEGEKGEGKKSDKGKEGKGKEGESGKQAGSSGGKGQSGEKSGEKNGQQNSSGGAGEANSTSQQQQTQIIPWESLSKQQQANIINVIANDVAETISKLDRKLNDEKVGERNKKYDAKEAAAARKMNEDVKKKTADELDAEAKKEGSDEANKARKVIEMLKTLMSNEVLKKSTLERAEEDKILKMGESLDEVEPKSFGEAPFSPAITASPVIRRTIQEIFHKSKQLNAKKGIRFDYNKLIKKVISPEKNINVFNKKQQVEGGEYWFLLDLSGSMSGYSLATLKKAMLTLYDSIVPLSKNIKFRIFGFADHRITELNRAQLVTIGNGGGTPTGEALAKVYKKMKDENRNAEKTLFVITDGAPDNAYDTQAALKLLKKRGVSVFTILIGVSGSEGTYYKKTFGNSKAFYGIRNINEVRPLLERIIIRDVAKKLRV